MHAAMYRRTEQESSMEVKNAVNSKRIICFMQGILHKRKRLILKYLLYKL